MNKFKKGDRVLVPGVIYATAPNIAGVAIKLSHNDETELVVRQSILKLENDQIENNKELANFKKETLETIAQSGKTPEEILMDLKDHLTN